MPYPCLPSFLKKNSLTGSLKAKGFVPLLRSPAQISWYSKRNCPEFCYLFLIEFRRVVVAF
jgi:hypothetical protein